MGDRSIALVVAMTLAACGPIGYVSTVRGADTAVEEARAVNAAKYAPYEWTRAVEYLRQARAEAAYADFQAANRFGRLSAEAAAKAKADAIRRAADPRLMDEITAPAGTPGSPGTPRSKGKLAPVIDADDDPAEPLAPATDDETPPGLEPAP